MAIFKNPPPEGFIYPAISEKQFIGVLKDLPSKWMFWYEPTLHGGQTPDFIIWIPAEEFPVIFLIELKNWRRTEEKKILPLRFRLAPNLVFYINEWS